MRTDLSSTQTGTYLNARPVADDRRRAAEDPREAEPHPLTTGAGTGRGVAPGEPGREAGRPGGLALPGQGVYAPSNPDLAGAVGTALPPPSLLARTVLPLADVLGDTTQPPANTAAPGSRTREVRPAPTPGISGARHGEAAARPAAAGGTPPEDAPDGAAVSPGPAPGRTSGQTPTPAEGEAQPGVDAGSSADAGHHANASAGADAEEPAGGPEAELTEEEKREVEQLKQRDREVRQHEQAHLAAAAGYARGGPTFDYATGPDNKRYAVGGEVSIDTSRESEPEATIRKAQIIYRAAMAPAQPSGQDRQVASSAKKMESEARQELAEQRREESGISGAEGAEDVEGGEGADAAAETGPTEGSGAAAAAALPGSVARNPGPSPTSAASSAPGTPEGTLVPGATRGPLTAAADADGPGLTARATADARVPSAMPPSPPEGRAAGGDGLGALQDTGLDSVHGEGATPRQARLDETRSSRPAGPPAQIRGALVDLTG